MTLEPPEAKESRSQVHSCAFCLKRLGDEFYFSCLACRATYCYIHMSRHTSCRAKRPIRRRAQGMRAVAPIPRSSSANV